MKKEDLKEKLKQEIESEASALERRVNTKKGLASLEMPEDSYEDLMERIRAKKESEQESVDKPKRKVKIIPFGTRRKALATVAMVAVLVVGTGLGVNGARLYMLHVENRDGQEGADIITDTEDICYIELTENEAYKKIEEELGILALRITDRPEDLKLEKTYIDVVTGEAVMEFQTNEYILTIYENKQNDDGTFNTRLDGEKIDTIEVFHLGKIVEIIKVDKGNGELFYSMQLEYANAFYYLSSDMELEELEDILRGIIFNNI